MQIAIKFKLLFYGTCLLLCLILKVKGQSDCNNEVGKNESVPCGGPESFLNLCGICVGGQTGRMDTEGLDRCKVCGGDDSCVGCDGVMGSNKIADACGACLAPDDELRDNCTKITSVFPTRLDRAVEKVTTVNLRGAGINPTNLPDVSCSLEPTKPQQQGEEALKIVKMSVEDGVIQLEVKLTENKLGMYTVNCTSNSIGPIDSGNEVILTLVDSKQLCITEWKPNNVIVGQEFQVELTIPSVLPNSRVLCYVQRKGQQTAEVVQAAEVTTGRVKCKPYTAQRASHMEWGAAYTWDAAIDRESCPSSVDLTATAPPPVIQTAEFNDGLRQIRVVFDHNVDGSEKCSEIFTPDTLVLLGKDANCSYVANSLIITLGSKPKLRINSELVLLNNSKVFREQSDPTLTSPASGKITLTPPDAKTSTPTFVVMAPTLICPDAQLGSALGRTPTMTNTSSTNSGTSPQVIRLIPPPGQKLEYNWTVNFNATPKDQRHNLKIWKSVRMLQNQLKNNSKYMRQGSQININTSMLVPGVEYKVSVSGTNVLGIQGKKQEFIFQVMSDTKKNDSKGKENISLVQMVIRGPATTFSNANNYFEVAFVFCEPQISKPSVNYQWKIEGELAQKMNPSTGKRLYLREGMLQGGKVYNISCTCTSESKDVGKINLSSSRIVTVRSQGLKAHITKEKVILGTGQALQLDASKSQDLDSKPGTLQFLWCCRTLTGNRCLLPRAGEAATVESAFKDAFRQPVLNIPSGVLPVGKYNFTVEVSKAGASVSKAQAVVEIIPGRPAIVNTPSGAQTNVVNPKEGVTIPAVVMNTREGCRMWWSVQQEPGHEYFNLAEVVGLGDAVLVTLEESKDVVGREFPLVIPGPTGTWPGLKNNAVYKLRLTVVCPPQGKRPTETSSADFLITTNAPPVVKPLKVNPARGQGLQTKFKFTTNMADDTSSDYPLQYIYGYRINDQDQIHLFSTSNVFLTTTTTLPAVTASETVIIPVLKVCDIHQLCSTVTGQQILTTLPNNLTLMEVQELGAQFADYVATEQYPEALSIAQTSLQTLKQLPNQGLYTAEAEIIEAEIRKELQKKQERLDANSGSLQSSLDFLEMSINVLRELPMSGSTLQDLSAFKDKILSLAKYNSELRLKYTSFPDRHSASKIQSRQRRSSENAPPTTPFTPGNVEAMLKLSETLITTGNSSIILDEEEKLLKALSTYMYRLCLGTDQKISLGNTIVHLSVHKLLSKDYIMKTPFYIPDRTKRFPAVNETGLIQLDHFIAEKFGSYGKTCLGGAGFPTDFLTDVAMGRSKTLIKQQKRGSTVFELRLVNTGNEAVLSKLDHPITFKLPVDITLLKTGQTLQCATWNENSWKDDSCSTNEEVFTLNLQPYVECKCSVLGYFTVLVIDIPTTTIPTTDTTTTSPTTTTSTTTTVVVNTTVETTTTTTTTIMTESTSRSTQDVPSTSSDSSTPDKTSCVNLPSAVMQEGVPISKDTYNISFRIEEDFNITVGTHKEEFEQKLWCEILTQVKMPAKMIQHIDVAPGSIIVTVRLVDTDVKTAKEVIPAIAQALQNGELEAHGLDNRKLKIPPQTITIIEPYRSEKSNTVVYAVVGSVIFSTLCIVSLITGAVIVKRKREAERLRKKQIPTITGGVPTYRQFQFEHSIEGTEASLARYRSNYPTMGTAGTLMMGTAMNTIGNRPGIRYEPQMINNQYLHPDISYNASQTSKKKKKKQRQGVHRAGSQGGLLNQEETPLGDQDSGIVDGYTNSSDDRNMRQRNKDKKTSSGSATEFDVLPGTPTEES